MSAVRLRSAPGLLLVLCCAPAFVAQKAVAQKAVTQKVAVPERAEAETLVRSFDEAFNRRDLDAALTCFAFVHRRPAQAVEKRIRAALSGPSRLERHSEITRTWTANRHLVALVHSTVTCTSSKTSVVEDDLAVFTHAGSELRVTLLAEVDAAHLAAMSAGADDRRPLSLFHCAPCNYRIDAGGAWLPVPDVAQRTGCYESMTFWSLDHDLQVTLSIHLARAAVDPLTGLRELDNGTGTGTAEHDAREPLPEKWTPASISADPSCPTAPRGAHLGVRATDDDEDVETWLLTFGRVSYLFVARGSRHAFAQGRTAIDELLRSFALDDPAADPQVVAQAIERAHLAVDYAGAEFAHRRTGVHFSAPTEFTVQVQGGATLFDASWSCPLGRPTFRLRGFPPPQGMAAWTLAAASRMLDATIGRSRLLAKDDSGWTRSTAGFAQERRIELAVDGDVRRVLRIGFDQDVMVVLEADTTGALDLEHARTALQALGRTR